MAYINLCTEEVNVCLCEAVDYTDSPLGVGEISVANARIYPSNWATLKSSAAGLKKKKKKKKTVGRVTYNWASLKSLATGKKANVSR